MAEIVPSVKIKTKGDISGIFELLKRSDKSQIVVFSKWKREKVQDEAEHGQWLDFLVFRERERTPSL